MMASPWDLDRAELAEFLADQPRFRVDQVWHGLYERGVSPESLTVLPKDLRRRLSEHFQPALDLDVSQRSDDGATTKVLWRLADEARIESVLMHYRKRSTVCVSSQAGCAMGCGFCATGQGGYERHLTVGEILEQVVWAQHQSAKDGRRLSNIVLMGMGEPFANYDRVLTAVRRMVGDLGIGARHITVSTIGLVPQIRRFADEGLQVGLAVSLHAANDELRSELVPVNRQHPIAEVVAAAREVRERTGRRVSFEWAMMGGTNDRDSDAAELIDVARRADAHVNLIPLNPTPGALADATPPDRIRAFADRLSAAGVNVTIRANRGTDIDAACGQLRAASRQGAGATPAASPVQIGRRRGASGQRGDDAGHQV